MIIPVPLGTMARGKNLRGKGLRVQSLRDSVARKMAHLLSWSCSEEFQKRRAKRTDRLKARNRLALMDCRRDNTTSDSPNRE